MDSIAERISEVGIVPVIKLKNPERDEFGKEPL